MILTAISLEATNDLHLGPYDNSTNDLHLGPYDNSTREVRFDLKAFDLDFNWSNKNTKAIHDILYQQHIFKLPQKTRWLTKLTVSLNQSNRFCGHVTHLFIDLWYSNTTRTFHTYNEKLGHVASSCSVCHVPGFILSYNWGQILSLNNLPFPHFIPTGSWHFCVQHNHNHSNTFL